MKMLSRLWDKELGKYRKDGWAVLPNGKVLDVIKGMVLDEDSYILEHSADWKDIESNELYDGDVAVFLYAFNGKNGEIEGINDVFVVASYDQTLKRLAPYEGSDFYNPETSFEGNFLVIGNIHEKLTKEVQEIQEIVMKFFGKKVVLRKHFPDVYNEYAAYLNGGKFPKHISSEDFGFETHEDERCEEYAGECGDELCEEYRDCEDCGIVLPLKKDLLN